MENKTLVEFSLNNTNLKDNIFLAILKSFIEKTSTLQTIKFALVLCKLQLKMLVIRL